MASPITVELKATIDDFKAKMAEAQSTAERTGSTLSDKLASAGKAIALGLGGAAVTIGGAAVKMASDFDAAQARMSTAIGNVGQNFDAFKSKIAATDDKLSNYGFTSTQTESALASLIPATKDTGKALDLMSLAANIARGRHIDLQQATDLLVKVETGHVALLGRLGINIKDNTGKTIDATTAVQRLSDMYGGQAAANADTFSGKTEVLKAKIDDLGVKLGNALIPVLEQLASVVANVIDWFEKHKAIAEALAGVIGTVLVGAMAAWVAKLVGDVASAISKTIDAIGSLVQKMLGISPAAQQTQADTTAAMTGVQTSMAQTEASVTTDSASIETSLRTVGTTAETTAADVSTSGETIDAALMQVGTTAGTMAADVATSAEGIGGSLAIIGTDAGAMSVEMATATTGVEADLEGMVVAADMAEVGMGAAFTGMLGPIGLVAAALMAVKPLIDAIGQSGGDPLANARKQIPVQAGGTGGAIDKPLPVDPKTGLTYPASMRAAGKASGGPVTMGRSYIVGERGPELFTPGSSGAITPNDAMRAVGGSGPHFHGDIHVHLATNDASTFTDDLVRQVKMLTGAA